ncbi:hypothetical protein DV735_g2922, partial [Chaetothyriales sp. CBS 134920]
MDGPSLTATLLYAYAGALLTIAYSLLTSPVQVLTSAALILGILGEAMHIREASFQPARARLDKGLPALSAQSTQLLAIVGLVLAGFAFALFVFAAGLGEMYALVAAQAQFLNIALVQVLVSGGLCVWIYVLHSGRSEDFFSSSSSSTLSLPSGGFSTIGDVLGNQVVFSNDAVDEAEVVAASLVAELSLSLLLVVSAELAAVVASDDASLEAADVVADVAADAAAEPDETEAALVALALDAVQPAAVGRLVTPAGWQMLRAYESAACWSAVLQAFDTQHEMASMKPAEEQMPR